MADVLPVNFPVPEETSFTSYSYVDIADGVARQIYLGSHSKNTTTDNYFMTGNTSFYANDITTSVSSVSSGVNDSFEEDFNITFNVPKVVEGQCFINVPIVLDNSVASNTNAVAVVTIKKDSTTLATATSETFAPTGTGELPKLFGFNVDVPRTVFGVGSDLVMSVKITTNKSGGGTTALYVGHDPRGRNGGVFTTDAPNYMAFEVPFKLDIE